MYFFQAKALGKRIAHIKNSLGAGFTQFTFDHFAIGCFLIQTIHANFQATQGFLETFLKGAAHGHHFAHTLHLCGQAVVGCGELFECKTWNLGDHVVDGRLERRGGQATSDVVFQFIKGVTHRQLGCHFGNREARGFGCQSR